MKSPFDYFDEIYCINLERRKDRWEQCKSEFDKIGISDRVIKFNAFDNKENPKRGCYDSHLSVIKLAYERKLKNVLIFEDDVAFLKRYDDRKLIKAIENLDKHDWEFFYLGGLERRMNPRPKYNYLRKKWDGDYNADFDYIMECRSVGWAQSFAVNSTIFERVADDYDNNIWEVLVEKYESHLDRYYQKVLKPKTYACVPTLTTQYNLVSDLSRTRTNKSLRLSPEDNE
jgi:GR25 family glycosyltransferase involved in LPS biosynthesis